MRAFLWVCKRTVGSRPCDGCTCWISRPGTPRPGYLNPACSPSALPTPSWTKCLQKTVSNLRQSPAPRPIQSGGGRPAQPLAFCNYSLRPRLQEALPGYSPVMPLPPGTPSSDWSARQVQSSGRFCRRSRPSAQQGSQQGTHGGHHGVSFPALPGEGSMGGPTWLINCPCF